jgi:hypothetical protein
MIAVVVAAALMFPQDRSTTVDSTTGGYTITDNTLPAGPQTITVMPKMAAPDTKARNWGGKDYQGPGGT